MDTGMGFLCTCFSREHSVVDTPGLLHALCVLQKQGWALSFCKQALILYSRAEWTSGIYPSLLCLGMHTVCRMWQIRGYRILELPQHAMIPCGPMGNVGPPHG